MTRDELIKLGKHKVRGNSDLMRIYIQLFSERFGYSPNCAGCTFSNDWEKFVSSPTAISSKPIAMNKTFQFKRNTSDIIAYVKDKKTYRAYANKASEEFITDYLTYGSESEIAERKKLFSTLPVSIEVVEKKEATVKKTRKPRTKKK